MAAGAPPDNFGGNHAFMADPADAGPATVNRDLAALVLQMSHFVRATANGAGDQALIDGIAAQARVVLAASDNGQARERSTRELQPITRVPNDAYGANPNAANIRMQNIPIFSGSEKDTIDIVRWLGRALNLAGANQLTFEATITLLIQASSNGAADYIEQMQAEGRTLQQVVQQLEMRYGDLCTPEEARVKCNNMPRKDREGLPEFIDRLRRMARMACRLIQDNDDRLRAIDALVEANIRRVLPTSVRNALEERVINRSRMGLPAFTAREVEKECLELEKRRDERRNNPAIPAVARKQANARFMQANFTGETLVDSSSEEVSSDDVIDTDDDATHALVNEIKQQERKYAARGQPVDKGRLYKKAFRRYNDKLPPPRYPKKIPGHQGARQAGAVGNNAPAPQGPPNKLDVSQRRTISELLTLANCTRGHCIQCGFEGHYMHSDACALRDKPLVDRPCAKCSTGLHSADDCPKVFQQKYVTPQKADQANVVIIDDLNQN